MDVSWHFQMKNCLLLRVLEWKLEDISSALQDPKYIQGIYLQSSIFIELDMFLS